jgi:DNA topoisomerase-2
MKDNKVIQLSEIEHILQRSARYLGSITMSKVSRFYLVVDKIKYGEVEYVPALLKLIREVLDNSIDEALRTNFKFANKIKITSSNDTIIIEDNGRGIPVAQSEDSSGNKLDDLMPTLAWCSLRAGSNFADEADNTTIGQNGEGASLCNVWSKEFIGETGDGNNFYKVVCKNNLSSKKITTRPGKKRFTKVTFKPDLERMNLTEISPLYMDLLAFDLMFLQETYPNIKFTFERK